MLFNFMRLVFLIGSLSILAGLSLASEKNYGSVVVDEVCFTIPNVAIRIISNSLLLNTRSVTR